MFGHIPLQDSAQLVPAAEVDASVSPAASRKNDWPRRLSTLAAATVCLALCISSSNAQTSGNSSLTGVVSDPTGAVVPGATVEIRNPVSQFSRSTTTDGEGKFSFTNIPFNPYHLSVTATGFGQYGQDVDVKSAVPLNLKVGLQIQSSQSVTVEAGAADLIENDPTFHTDIERQMFD
jgi:hypothetical protein